MFFQHNWIIFFHLILNTFPTFLLFTNPEAVIGMHKKILFHWIIPTRFLSSALTRRKEKQDWKHNKQYWDSFIPCSLFMGEEEQDVIVWKRKMWIWSSRRLSALFGLSILRKSENTSKQHKNHSNINMLHLHPLSRATKWSRRDIKFVLSHVVDEATVVFGRLMEKLLPCTWCQQRSKSRRI